VIPNLFPLFPFFPPMNNPEPAVEYVTNTMEAQSLEHEVDADFDENTIQVVDVDTDSDDGSAIVSVRMGSEILARLAGMGLVRLIDETRHAMDDELAETQTKMAESF